MKGEVSVRNLVWKRKKAIELWSGKGRGDTKLSAHPAPAHQSQTLHLLSSYFPQVHVSEELGWGSDHSREEGLLGESPPCPPLPCHIKAKAQVKDGVADS